MANDEVVQRILERIGTNEYVEMRLSEILQIVGVPADGKPKSTAAALSVLSRFGFAVTLHQGTKPTGRVRICPPSKFTAKRQTGWATNSLSEDKTLRRMRKVKAELAKQSGSKSHIQSIESIPKVDLIPAHEYRVLSIQPPWAWAIFFAGKDIENRSWDTQYRGPLLIHASSKKFVGDALLEVRQMIAIASKSPLDAIPVEFPRSQMLGIVELTDTVENAQSPWAEKDSVHWQFEERRLLSQPVKNVNGKLNLWTWKS